MNRTATKGVGVTDIDELMKQIPIGDMAGMLGISEDEAERAVRSAVPALVGGMQANAHDPAGAASLARAFDRHGADGLLDGGIDLGQIDAEDGTKIVHNVFGENEDAVINRLGGQAGISSGVLAKLLPMLAPLVMAFLGRKLGSGGSAPAPASPTRPADSSGSGSVPPGMAPDQSEASDAGSGGGLGDLLGGMLGGSGGGLGDLLGGLLGAGKR